MKFGKGLKVWRMKNVKKEIEVGSKMKCEKPPRWCQRSIRDDDIIDYIGLIIQCMVRPGCDT